jgi:hypothetical protein
LVSVFCIGLRVHTGARSQSEPHHASKRDMFVSMTQKAVCHRKPRLLGVELLRLHAPYFINLFNKLATLNYLILIL